MKMSMSLVTRAIVDVPSGEKMVVRPVDDQSVVYIPERSVTHCHIF